MKVVSLSSWPEPEVVLNDNGMMRACKVGDSLVGGRIVMIDYRLMPYPDDKNMFSQSRLVLRIGNDYWAVERGWELSQRYKLSGERVPPAIRQGQ